MFTKKFIFKDIQLSLYASSKGLTKLDTRALDSENPNEYLSSLCEELKKYLEGKAYHFDFPLDIQGTQFQLKVWNELKKIPSGQTRSYKDIALKVGGSNYSRAVGMANNKNPLPIVIPCHRVVGSNGDLVGYALGLKLKQNLLKIEGAI